MCCHHQPRCSHTFVWYGVVPPSHCPICGACLTCGAPRVTRPYYPQINHWTRRPQSGDPMPYYSNTNRTTL